MSTLFDVEPSLDATVSESPADVALAGGIVKCAGHGGSILLSVAIPLKVGREAAYVCRQRACIAVAAQDLAARGCELL